MYYRMFATGAAIEGSATIAGYSMNNTAMLLDTRDVLTHRTLVDPHVKVEMGKAGSCEFTILPTHTLYDKLKRMVTFITVEEIDPDINHDIVLFKGRIVELETDLYGQKKVTCEGDLAYLGDSYTPPLASKNTVIAVPRYFEEIITQHNGQVEAAKQFTVGDTSAFSGIEDKFSESSYQNSSRALEDLIEYHGGYLRTRHEGGTTYLDYVKDTATPGRAVPRVEFAKNLVDFTEKVSAEDIFTVLIPLGDKTDTGEGTDANSVPLTLTPPKLNVDDVIQGAKAIETFGYILRAETFSGVKDAVTLRQRAEAYIRANYNALPEEFTVKAIDLRYLDDADAQVPFEVGENITIVVPVRGVSKTLKCLSIQYDLFNPDATEIEVGTGKQEIRQRSLTDQQAQTDAKSKSSAKSAKANTAATEYLTWKDIKAAKELNLTAQKINLLSDSAGGEIVVKQNGQLTFQWDNNKGLKKEVVSAASVASTANETANTAKNKAKTAQDTADANKTEVEHHAMTLYGANTSYGDWAKANATLAKGGLMTFFDGKIAALEGYFDSVTANNVTTWGLSAQVSRFESITGHNLTATGITVRTATDSSGQDVVQLGGTLQETPPVMTVSGNGTVYVKDIKQLDNAKNWQSVVTHPEYPLLSIKTISNKKYLVAGADTAGQDGYSLTVQKVALEDLLDGANLADYAQLNTNVTFGTVTGSSFALSGTNSQGQPNSYTFTKHYIKMDDVAKIEAGVNLPYYLGENDLDLSHTHEIEFTEVKDSNNQSTGQYKLTLKKAVKRQAQTDGETATFSIASTKFFQDAIAGASVYSIAYDGASNTNPAMSVGTKTIPGTSAQVKVLNNVPLLVTYGTDGVTQSTKTYKVSEVELPSVSFQNGSGGTPAITYSGGKPTIDVKAVMSGTTIKSAETYTGNAITLRPSFTAPSASAANKTFTLVAYDGTTISDDTKITSKDVTLQHEIGQITSKKKKYLRVRTNVKNDSGESSSPVFYTDYRITWNSDSIQNTNGSSSVTAKVSINGVQYDTHKFTGTYATVSDIVNNGNAYLDGSNLKVPAKAIDSSENTLKTANVQVGAISVVGDGGKITEYSQSKKVSFRISGQEIASGTVTAEYPMSVSSTALSSASIALNSRDELFYITANQTITLGDNTSDTTHPLYFPWYTGQYKTYGDDGNSGYGTVIVTAKSGSSATESSQTTVSTNKTYVHPVLTKGSNILFNNNADAYDSYVNAIVREVNGTASSAETVRQLAKETFVISSKAIGVANSTDSTLYALSTAQLGSAVGSGTTYSHRIWSIGHVDALAETIADEPESFNIIAKASASNVTTGKASTKMTLWADSLRIDPGSTTTVKAMIGTTEYASIDIEAKASSAGDLSTVEASFSDPTRTNLDSNGAFYSSTIKAVASSNDTVISESTPAAITATYGVISRTDNRLYGVGLAKFNGVTYAQNGDWIANLSLNREEADQGSNYDFYMTSSVKTNARCSAVSVGTTLCTISIPMWLSASNATLSPGETRNISCSLYGSVSGADTLFASKSIRITCSGGGGSGGSDSNDLQTGWDAAVDKVSIPHGLSSNAAEFKIGYPTDVYDTGTNAYFTLSQSGSMAYVKDRSDNIVAQLSLTGAGGSSSGSPEDGWNEAIRRVVVPNWAGSGSSFSVSYPKDSYTTVTGQGVGTRNYTITQNGSYVYVTTKNASNLDVNVAVKAVDVSAGWTAAKNVTTYPTNANSGSDTISITAPKDAAYMNDTVNYDTIQYKLVQSGNNVYLQNQTTMQNVAGKSITQQGVNAGTVNIGTIDADGQQHTVFASSYGYTHMTQLTYTAPAKPTHAISRKASVSRSTFQQMKIASGYENITWEQVFATGVQAAGYYGIVVQCGNAYKGYYFNK